MNSARNGYVSEYQCRQGLNPNSSFGKAILKFDLADFRLSVGEREGWKEYFSDLGRFPGLFIMEKAQSFLKDQAEYPNDYIYKANTPRKPMHLSYSNMECLPLYKFLCEARPQSSAGVVLESWTYKFIYVREVRLTIIRQYEHFSRRVMGMFEKYELILDFMPTRINDVLEYKSEWITDRHLFYTNGKYK